MKSHGRAIGGVLLMAAVLAVVIAPVGTAGAGDALVEILRAAQVQDAAGGSTIVEADQVSRQRRLDRLQRKEAASAAGDCGGVGFSSRSYSVQSTYSAGSGDCSGGFGSYGSARSFGYGVQVQPYTPPVQVQPFQRVQPAQPPADTETMPKVPADSGRAQTSAEAQTKVCPNCGGLIDMATGQHITGPTHAPVAGYGVAAMVDPDTGTVQPLVPQYSAPAAAATVQVQPQQRTYVRTYSYSGTGRRR